MQIKKNTGHASKSLQTSNVPTKEFQFKEIVKCGKDPLYFIKNYVKISHPVKGYIPFTTFDFQDDCVKQYLKNRFIIVNKSRQLGLSTISAAYSLWMAIFQREKNILVVATKLDVAKLFIKKVEDMLRSLPPWLVMPNLTIKSVKEIGFSNGSRIKATPTSITAARGEALSLVIVDEAAHIEGIDEMWLAMWSTLSTGGSAILISTPLGVGNLFHRLWVDAMSKENEFVPIELPWTVHPERNQAWFDSERKQIIAAMGERGVQQELLCQFNGSGDTFLPGNVLDLLSAGVKDPIGTHHLSSDLWVWNQVESGHKYIIPCDVASGAGKDYTAFHVIDIKDDKIVAEFKSNKTPVDDISKILLEIGKEYNTALLCPELNSYGLIVSKNIKDANYPNVFYEKFKNMYSGFLSNQEIRPQDLPGIYTGPKNRDEMLAKLETTLRNGHLRIPSKRVLEEFKTFIWRGSKAEAMKGYNDDLVIALALGISLFETSGQVRYSEEEFSKALLLNIARSSTSLTINPGGYGKASKDSSIFIPPVFMGSTFSEQTAVFNQNMPQQNNPLAMLKVQQAMQDKAKQELQKQNAYDQMNPMWSWLLK